MRTGLHGQIEEIRSEWEKEARSFFLSSGICAIYLPRRFRAGSVASVFPASEGYPPVHISMKHSFWCAPGEYLQIGFIITEALPDFPRYCPVCISVVPRMDWIFQQQRWLSDTVPARYETSIDRYQKHEEVVSAVSIEAKIEKAEKQDGYFYADSSFVVLENPKLLRFKIWRSTE